MLRWAVGRVWAGNGWRRCAAGTGSAARTTHGKCMKIFYAIGDVHGELGKLRELLSRITADARGREGEKLGIFLGDYIDRGPTAAASSTCWRAERRCRFLISASPAITRIWR